MAIYRHPDGRQPIGVAQQPTPCYDYPLVAPVSEDVRYLIADLRLVYEDPALYDSSETPYQPPFRIARLVGLGELDLPENPPGPRCIIVDATDRIVLDTFLGSVESYSYGNRLRVYVWKKLRQTLYLTVHTHWSPEGSYPEAKEYAFDMEPARAIIDGRAVVCAPKTVQSFSALDVTEATGAFEFVAGYNKLIDVTQDTESLRQQNQLIMNSIPGAGDGVFQDCDQQGAALSSIGGARPSADGKFFIVTDDCTWVRQPIIEIEGIRQLRPNSLQLGDNCKPCCDCQDYSNVAIELYRLQQRYKGIGNKLNDVRTSYHNANRKWKSRKSLLPQYSIDLKLVPQFCPQLDVIMQVNNGDPVPMEGAEFLIELEATGISVANPPTLVGNYAQAFYPDEVDGEASWHRATFDEFIWPRYIISIVRVGAKSSGIVKFRLEFEDCTPRAVTVRVAATIQGIAAVDENGDTIIAEETVGICGYEIAEEEEEGGE